MFLFHPLFGMVVHSRVTSLAHCRLERFPSARVNRSQLCRRACTVLGSAPRKEKHPWSNARSVECFLSVLECSLSVSRCCYKRTTETHFRRELACAISHDMTPVRAWESFKKHSFASVDGNQKSSRAPFESSKNKRTFTKSFLKRLWLLSPLTSKKHSWDGKTCEFSTSACLEHTQNGKIRKSAQLQERNTPETITHIARLFFKLYMPCMLSVHSVHLSPRRPGLAALELVYSPEDQIRHSMSWMHAAWNTLESDTLAWSPQANVGKNSRRSGCLQHSKGRLSLSKSVTLARARQSAAAVVPKTASPVTFKICGTGTRSAVRCCTCSKKYWTNSNFRADFRPFSLKVLSEGDRTDFFQEEQLGLPYWTMSLAIRALVDVDVSKYLGILTVGIFNNFGASSIERTSMSVHKRVSPFFPTLIRVSKNCDDQMPSNLNPASKEMICDSVQLCETEVCFLHIQFMGTNMYDFQKCTMFLQKWILNLQDLLRSQSLETVPVCIVWQYYTHDNIVFFHVYDEFLKSNDSGVCHMLWSILWWILQVCSLTREYQVFQRAKYKHFRTIWEQTFDSFPTDFNSSSLKWWSSMQGVDTL